MIQSASICERLWQNILTSVDCAAIYSSVYVLTQIGELQHGINYSDGFKMMEAGQVYNANSILPIGGIMHRSLKNGSQAMIQPTQ